MRINKLTLIISLFFYSAFILAQCPTVGISGTQVNCFGGNNGTVTASVSGGSGSYSYAWNNGGNSPSIAGLTAGVYFVNVTDLVSGCTVFNLFVVNEPNQLQSTLTQQNVNCFGQSTGSIDLTPIAGSPPYSYAWSNAAVSQDIVALAAGGYTVTITDSHGCTASNNTIITQTASSVNSNIVSHNTSCPLGSDGSINLTIFGGEPPYTFSWNNGTYLSEDISGLTTATYNVIITDALGCTSNNGIFISEPTAITSNVTGTDVTCFGAATGTVNLSPSGGTPPYSFTWTNTNFTLGNTEDLINVAADTYNVTITDANGCTQQNSYTVNEPTQLTSDISGINVTCNGYSDGSVTLIVNGGSAPYSFHWTNSVSAIALASQNLTNIPAETYSVTINDFNGCVAHNSIIITQPLLPLTSSIVGTDVKCFGDNSGTADLTIVGGTPPYFVNWSNSVITEDQPNLFQGSYVATTVDINGCLTSSNITINQPAAPLSITTAITNVSCFGFSNGTINNTVNGGTTPYQYSWINSQFALSVVSQDISNFPAESYVITVTDANGCLLVDTSVITQPAKLQSNTVGTNIKCYGDSTGAINLSVNGGTIPYGYVWSNGMVTQDLNNLVAGTYTVTITDLHGCIQIDSAILTQPAAPLSTSYFVKNTTCNGGTDGYIFYNVQGGTLPYLYNWSNGDTLTNIFNLSAGGYVITTTDGNSCTITDSITLAEPLPVTITSTVTPVSCYNQANGIIDITINGGTGAYTYLWMSSAFILSAITQDLVNFPADTYNVEVTDSVGCHATVTIPLPQPPELVVEVTAMNEPCYGESNGLIDISISGGVSPYNSLWSNGAITEDILNIPAGTYTDTIHDANNCLSQQTYIIQQPPEMIITVETQIVSCTDQHDGIFTVLVTGGSGTFNYLWSDSTTSNIATNLGGQTYTLTVTDITGCVKDTLLTMPVNPVDCIDAPTAFTPNGDGKNDEWQIKNIELYPNCVMKVFNRWGNILFESSRGYTERWNGRYNGQKLPSETYYYLLDLGNDTHPKTGAVTIVY